MPFIRAVVFDVGETLVDETELWGDWADWLGIPRFTLFGALGGVIARGGDHNDLFPLVRPGIDLHAERAARRASGRRQAVTAGDLYPDAVACLQALIADGYLVGVAANQPETTEAVVRGFNVDLAIVASSERWGVSKPDAAFFDRIATELGLEPEAIAYVGDRLDNDIAPAARAGMTAVFLRRGPWAILQSAVTDPATVGAAATIESLVDLPAALKKLT